jgi:2-hydroxychromene-2-carboxylate isomerase
MLLGGVFQATGNASPAAIPAKARHSMIDLQRFARRYGVPMHFNPYFPINTLTLMRGAIGLQLRQPERFEAYLEAMFRALWENKRNLGDPAVLAATLQDAGFDPQALLSLASDQTIKDALKSATEEAVRRGVFGAPTCFVGDEMFFGQDRLDFVEEALA